MSTFSTLNPITATLTTAGARVRIAAGERTDTVIRVEPVNSANAKDVKAAEKTKVDFSGGVLSFSRTGCTATRSVSSVTRSVYNFREVLPAEQPKRDTSAAIVHCNSYRDPG